MTCERYRYSVRMFLNREGCGLAKRVRAHTDRSGSCHATFSALPRSDKPSLIPPAALVWNDGAVRKIAQLIYDDRAFDRLPLLADALEDAGCTDAAILAHCRDRGDTSAAAGSSICCWANPDDGGYCKYVSPHRAD